MSLIDQEIASNPSQGVVMENICLHTSPFDLLVTTTEANPSHVNALGLAIGVGVTVRVGRERSWNVSYILFFFLFYIPIYSFLIILLLDFLIIMESFKSWSSNSSLFTSYFNSFEYI